MHACMNECAKCVQDVKRNKEEKWNFHFVLVFYGSECQGLSLALVSRLSQHLQSSPFHHIGSQSHFSRSV